MLLNLLKNILSLKAFYLYDIHVFMVVIAQNQKVHNHTLDIIFDKNGTPILRLLENGRLVDFKGSSIGFLDKDNFYDYNGNYMGWFENGILYDHYGFYYGFGENTEINESMIALPIKKRIPKYCIIQKEPLRPITHIAPIKHIKKRSWSKNAPI